MDIEVRIKQVMAAVFGVNASEIDERATPDTIEKWDSLAQMNLVIALEEEFGIQFGDEQLFELTTFTRIAETTRELLSRR